MIAKRNTIPKRARAGARQLKAAYEAVIAEPRRNAGRPPGTLRKPTYAGLAGSVESDPARAREIIKGLEAGETRFGEPLAQRYDAVRMAMRVSLLNPADEVGLERIIGTRDILQITFLHQALVAARSVCRLRVRSGSPGPAGFGTGFLVAPGVLLTNHHVLDTAATATLSLAEFDAELDLNYVHTAPRIFNLLPDKLFVTDADLDFTFVAVNSLAHDGTPLADFRWLTLLRESGKGISGEWVSIIQHPGGETKQIVIRDNRIVALPKAVAERVGPAFVHYTSDTEPGSSGSPVLNDQLEVLALHHKSVPKFDAAGNIVTHDDSPWTPAMGDAARGWIANEGVRISAIFRQLDRLAFRDPQAANLLAILEDGQPRGVFSVLAPAPATEQIGEGSELEATALARRKGKGYKPKFLGFEVPLPKPSKALEKDVQPLEDDAAPKGSRPGELVYTHFSVLMHAERRLAIFAAVNIDGKRLGSPTTKPTWRREGRVSKAAQSLNELYSGNELDKGHLVRRLDPCWGDSQQEINDAVVDTYHYTNAAPQEHSFNDGLWGDVEDYILGIAEASGHKISVFTGPVLDKDDVSYRASKPDGPWLIPARFWKVIAYKKSDGTQAATGFLLDQSDQIVDLEERLTPLPKARNVARVHQRTIKEIEGLTHLDFGPLRTLDPLRELETTRQVRLITIPGQIVL